MRARSPRPSGSARASRTARASADPQARPARRAPAIGPGVPPAPPWHRDPWCAVAVLSVVPLILHALGAPLGEPFADDFDYLHRALLEPKHSWLDGGGFALYWRPLGRQAYFALVAPWILKAPALVAVIHAALLAAIAFLVYRALRPRWSGPAAAAAASFVPLMESARMLIAWASHFMDLGALLFAALALYQASRTRWRFAVPAAVASLLCKEVGAGALLLLPWMPAVPDWTTRRRLRWSAALIAAIGAWLAMYAWVARREHFAFAGAGDAGGTSVFARVRWAMTHAVRAAFSLPESSFGSAMLTRGVYGGLAVAAVIAVTFVIARAGARRRVIAALPWSAWGIAWFVLASAPLATVYPTWTPYRGAFACLGLGIAIAAPLAAVDVRLLALAAAVRLVTFGIAPGAPRDIAQRPAEYGAAFDFERLARLERLTGGVRRLLHERFPHLPRGAAVGHHHLPHLSRFAFAGDKALHVWYRDTTLRWIPFEDLRAGFDTSVVTIVEYQSGPGPQLALVNPEALRALFRAGEKLDRGAWAESLPELARAESLQTDAQARVFRGLVLGKRALANAYLRNTGDAEREAQASLALWRDGTDARLVLAGLWANSGRLNEAEAQLDTLLAIDPGDKRAQALGASIQAAATRGR